MNSLALDNPVFETYALVSALMVLKVMLQGWMTVYRMIKSDSGLLNPEDLRKSPTNKNPRPDQLEVNDYVDRSRRMHRNDLENIPAFWAVGLVFVVVDPALLFAQILMYGFAVARLAHSGAYLTKQSHEVRAALYSIGSLIVIFMAAYVLWTVI